MTGSHPTRRRMARLAVTLLGVAAAMGVSAVHAPVAGAATCSPAISGPNDPEFAAAERNPASGSTFNAEQWPLFDCLPASAPAASDPNGTAGMSVNRAWQSFGRGNPGVTVAYMEGGVNWRLPDSRDLRRQAYLNTGELPWPQDASGHTHGTYDLDGDGKVTVDDYKDDPRIHHPFLHQNSAGGITPEDLIVAFGHCRITNHQLAECPANGSFDNDGNGYPNDISGWNFHRDTNDPQTDQSVYGHANGESRTAVAEADNGFLGAGVCPGCRLLTVKLGDEAIDRPDRVAEGIIYAVDAGAKVLDITVAALGQTPSMQKAVDYAYAHGVTIAWASNDFESADHTEGMRFARVWPGNSVVSDQSNRSGRSQPNDAAATTFTSRSSLTSYGAHSLFSVPTTDGSTSSGVPTTAGVAALVTSAGVDAAAAGQIARPLDANEVTQVTRATATPLQSTPCANCFPGLSGAEFNIQYGYGRPDLYRAMAAVHAGDIPPTADIRDPSWYDQLDPTVNRTVGVNAAVAAPRSSGYRWEMQYGLGPQPGDGDFHAFANGTGSAPQNAAGTLDLSQIPESFWAGAYSAPTADRLSIERYDVTVRVRVWDATGHLGEDRRVIQVRHDPSEITALHRNLGTSLESSPTLADLEGRGGLDVILAGSDGTVHALRPDGSEAPGWPVRTALARGVDGGYPSNYLGSVGWRSGLLPLPHEPIDAPLAVGDLYHNGALEVVATGQDGHVYVWDRFGHLRPGFPVATDRSVARQSVPPPDTPYMRNASTGNVGGAALGDLEGSGKLDIVMGGWDGHVYAWRPDGSPVPGWPVSTATPDAGHHPTGTSVYARDAKVATTPVLVPVEGSARPDVVVALQDTAFGSSGTPVFGFVIALSGQGNRHPGGPLLPGFPVALPAAEQGYGTAQDFITEGVQTPAAYRDPGGAKVVANPGLFFAQTIDGHSGRTTQEVPGTLGAQSALNPASPLVHFTTSASLGKVGGRSSPLAVQAGSAATDVATAIATIPGLGIQVRSGIDAWDPVTGGNASQFTQPIQGLAFLTAPAIADVSGDGRPDVLLSTDSAALHSWDGTTGAPLPGWPKWTGGWGLFTPATGDLTGDGTNTVVTGLREGWLHAFRTPGRATANAEAWHWHQNDWNTGLYGQDTRPPLVPRSFVLSGPGQACWTAPGDDWAVGTATRYELGGFQLLPTPERFAYARAFASGLPAPAAGGTRQCAKVPLQRVVRGVAYGGVGRWLALRAADAVGNLSYPAVIDTCAGRRIRIALRRVRALRGLSSLSVSMAGRRLALLRGKAARRRSVVVTVTPPTSGVVRLIISRRGRLGRRRVTVRRPTSVRVCVVAPRRRARAPRHRPVRRP